MRFTRAQRYLHAVLFTTFLGLAAPDCPCASARASGRADWQGAVGGFGAILFFHKFCALVLTVAFLIHVKEYSRADCPSGEGNLLGLDLDGGELEGCEGSLRPPALVCRPRAEAQFERYAYWEKFDYWAVFWGMIVIGFSGYAMWFAPFFAQFLPGWAFNAVLVIHSEEGLLAILFIFSIHFVNTHLRPDSFPMDMVIFTGVESEEEFKHKRPTEYARLVKEGKLEARIGAAPATWFVNFSRVVGYTAIAIGLLLLVLALTAYFD